MIDFLIARLEFILGFLGGSLFWWFLSLLRPAVNNLRESLTERVDSVRVGLSVGTEERYRQDMVRLAQDQHLASPIFALDEIAIPSKLLPPPPPVIPDENLPPDDAISLAVPYMPDWPSMAAFFSAPTLSIAEALGGGGDLLIFGEPGAGKTFALNQFTSDLARRAPEMEKLGETIPVYVHIADLELPGKKDKPLDVIYQAIYERVSTLTEAQLPGFLESIFKEGRVVLMLDGLDEMPGEEHEKAILFARQVKSKYPKAQLILTASSEFLPGVQELGLIPMPMAGWTPQQTHDFLRKWGQMWERHVSKESWAKELPEKLDTILLTGWMRKDPHAFSPMHLTLRTWAAYAGDATGPSPADAIDAYFFRMSAGIVNARPALEQLAAQMVLTRKPVIARQEAGRFVAKFEDPNAPDLATEDLEKPERPEYNDEPDESGEPEDAPQVADAKSSSNGKSVSGRGVRRMLPEMVQNRLLSYRPDGKISFTHAALQNYLAAFGLAAVSGGPKLLSQSAWSGRNMALEYYPLRGDVIPLLQKVLSPEQENPMQNNILTAARWPRHDGGAPWRKSIMRALANGINNAEFTLGFRARLVSALATSGDQGVDALFRKLLGSPNAEVRQLAALGCGAVQDENAVEALNRLIFDQVPNVGRAACLALAAIDTPQSWEMVMTALLHADEDVRRAAAEALSQNPNEGHNVLREGTQVDDLLVRRAAVFGLSRVKQPWAIEILQSMQVVDSQWVVRNAAGQALDMFDKGDPLIPKPQPALEQRPWLIAFASERGRGISAGTAAWDVVRMALKQGSLDQRLGALDIYREYPHEAINAINEIYELLKGEDHDLREAAYTTLWYVMASGVTLPPIKESTLAMAAGQQQ